MTGIAPWLGPLAAALVAALFLWRAKMPPLWIAALLAVAGGAYAAFGAPTIQSAPAAKPADPERTAAAAEQARTALLSDPGDIRLWSAYSAALLADGGSAEAVEALNFASGQLPPSADLQVQLGTALLAHADGLMTPAAQLAFGRASALDPAHPGPPYFLGMAYLQAGQPGEALKIWRDLAARTPPGAPWANDLARKIRAAETMQAAGVGG